jgi:hypothetical protein
MALLMMERSCLFLLIFIFLNSNHNIFLIDDIFFCNKKTVATWKRRCVHKQSLLKSSRKKNNVRAWRQVCYKSVPEHKFKYVTRVKKLNIFCLLRRFKILLVILHR